MIGKQKFLFASIFLLLMSFGFASAATTFTTPGASAIIRGNYTVNITSSLTDLLNCSFTAASALSGDSLATTTATNISASATWVSTDIVSVDLEDASDWVFSGTCYNASTSEAITSRTGVTVDNTVPTAPSGLSVSSTDDEANVGTWSATVTGSRTTACSMTVTMANYGSTTYTMTHSGNTCTYANYLSLPEQENAVWTVTATDGLNSTTSSSTSVGVTRNIGGAGFIPATSNDRESVVTDNKPLIVLLLLIVAVYGFNAGWFSTKKGVRRNRRR